MLTREQLSLDYAQIAQVIECVEVDSLSTEPLDLTGLAVNVGLSEVMLAALIRRWADCCPERFGELITRAYRQRLLGGAESVWGGSELHLVEFAAADIAIRDRLNIEYGIADCPFGRCLVGFAESGLCYLEFVDDGEEAAVARLRARWPEASLHADVAQAVGLVDEIFAGERFSLPLLVRGTDFQLQVWRALLELPAGAVVDYAGLARRVGRPQAARAVGAAVGANPIAWLIPCHRVLRSDGRLGGYHWGVTRKAACLLREQVGI